MPLVVRGALKDYDWGVVDGLAPWTGITTGAPQAELWYGAHPGGPSPVIAADGAATGEYLSTELAGGDVPLLVKILAASRPLSVQVHPDAELAAEGYRAQVASKDPSAVYADRSEKTEMLIALEPFDCLAGWRDATAAIAFLRALQAAADDFDPSAAIAALVEGDFTAAIPPLLSSTSTAAIAALGLAAQYLELPEREVHGYQCVASDYPQDFGALVTPLLGFLTLEPGDALFVPAGIPHSYISGLGIEVMTSSDNVLRLGLTTKPVHLDQALAALDLRACPQLISSPVGNEIAPADAPFAARLMRGGAQELASGSYRIVLAVEGEATVTSMGSETTLLPGMACVIAQTEPEVVVRAQGLTAVVHAVEPAA